MELFGMEQDGFWVGFWIYFVPISLNICERIWRKIPERA